MIANGENVEVSNQIGKFKLMAKSQKNIPIE